MASRRIRTIGIDPGPIPGLVELRYLDRKLVHVGVLQVSANLAAPTFVMLLAELSPTSWKTVVQVEKFIVTGRTAKLANAAASATTRDMVGALMREGEHFGIPVVQRTANQAKAWATDARLDAAGLLDATKGMRHAKDAARHALFAASHDVALPDPLSKEFKAS